MNTTAISIVGTLGILGGGLLGFYIQVGFVEEIHVTRIRTELTIWSIFQSKMLNQYRAERDLRITARLIRLEDMEKASSTDTKAK